jgi:N-acetylated-alpha-linked acidic dipeptidase
MAPDKSSRRSSSPPIPSYDEATSATNPLLGGYDGSSGSNHRAGYQPPIAHSVRSSEDSLYASRAPFDGPHVLTSDSDTDSETSEGLRRDLDDLDYHADDVELEELENGTVRRRRRLDGSWKGRVFDLRKRLGKWRNFWSFKVPHWASSGVHNWSWPTIPEGWKNSGAIIARLFGLFILISGGYALFAFAIFPAAQNELASFFDPEGIRQVAQSSVDPNRIRAYLEHITSFDHIAGTKGSFYLAEWIKDIMLSSGLEEVNLNEYDVYLNYAKPDGRKVAIIEPEELKWQATLEEEPLYPGRADGKANTPVFHGHSKTGTVSGPLIYCNYGSQQDYKTVCLDSGINCNGSIALVREFGSQRDRALKVKAAETWGISGVLIYSDPAEDGFKKGPVWPDGPWRPSDSVQRGAVSLMNWVIGDPLTPGWASSKGEKRLPVADNKALVNIPSLPLAWRDAQKLLQALKGHGQELPENWHGGVPDVEWWSGDDKSPKVLLQNEQDEVEQQRIFNVLGKVEGMETGSKAVIVGNHRDSWCFGAADP